MILGVDVSTYLEEIEKGAKYYDNGVLINPLKDLHDNGVDCMRIRLWNNPYDEKGVPYLAGTCDLDNFLKLSHLAKSLGYGILLDFHYSDFWADPGKQMIPKAWRGFSLEQMVEEVYTYTKETLQKIKAEGITLDYIQIGNEITNGILWPIGRLTEKEGERGNYSSLCALLSAGARACREESDAKLILHLERSHDQQVYTEFFTNMEKYGVDYDIIGASYYPYWHGTPDQFFANMENCKKFGKPRMVMELGYGFTLKPYMLNENGMRLVIGEEAMKEMGFTAPNPITVKGQADFVKEFLQRATVEGIEGIFYWEPLWIPGEGICWASPEGQKYIGEEGKSTENEWANQCLFDYKGNKLPSFDEFSIKNCKKA